MRELYSVKVKAGKRVYIFDVKATQNQDDYYVVITEIVKEEKPKKSRIFIYKEDFNKFLEGLTAAINHVKIELLPDYDYEQFDHSPIYYNRLK